MTTHIPNESLGSLGLSWHRASRRPTSGTTCESKEHARDSLSSLAAMLEDDIAKLRAATSCRRRPGEALALPPILRMGLAGFLTHINHISGRVVEEAQKEATAQRPRSHNERF